MIHALVYERGVWSTAGVYNPNTGPWMSIFNMLKREYGEEAVDYVTWPDNLEGDDEGKNARRKEDELNANNIQRIRNEDESVFPAYDEAGNRLTLDQSISMLPEKARHLEHR